MPVGAIITVDRYQTAFDLMDILGEMLPMMGIQLVRDVETFAEADDEIRVYRLLNITEETKSDEDNDND